MPRIPDETIERLKQEVSLERLVAARGVKLTRHGADLIGLCPFHDDHSPSLVVSPKKNLWNCLGACQTGGTVIDWVMKAEGVSFRHAVELLRADVPADPSAVPVKTSTVRKLAAPVDRSVDDAGALEQVTAYYHETLKQSPEALEYLQKRGLAHPEMIAHFRLGYANRTLGLRLPAKNRKAGEEIRTRLSKLGVIRDSGHEHLNGSVVIPVFSRTGEVLQMYGRKITPNLREGTPLHLYLPGPHRGVWNEAALEVCSNNASKEIILCESLIDALTFWCAGFRNVTASYGVNGFTEDHREAFRKYGVNRVWIAYDRDEAGDKAAEALAGELMTMGIECFRVLFPKGMDANEYAHTTQPAARALGVLLNSAQWIGKGLTSASPEEPAAKEETAEPVLPASSLAALAIQAATEVRPGEIFITFADRRYRVRGLEKNTSSGSMKVNLMATCGERFHIDTVNLETAQQRGAFARLAAVELGLKDDVVRHDLGKVLLKCEEIQDEQIRQALEPKSKAVVIEEEDRAAALELLRDPRLLDRIVEDFGRCGLVGEETNKRLGYLAAISRHLEAPLAVVVQSSSAAGKSSLMDAVLQFVPKEECVQFSSMTGQSLYYMGETDLKHKVLAIVEEEGASRASYALKLLQSEGVLSIASTGKDPATGRLITQQYRVEGPVMIFLTTTAVEIDEELLNRCLVLSVDEEREQTRAIHRAQREAQTLEGLLKRHERADIVRLHQNAQRLLKPLAVVNPRANELTFPDGLTRTRRDHMKYLTLIRASALLHQHQRPIRTTTSRGKTVEYIEANEQDLAIANRLVNEVLGRSLDELQAHTRRLLLMIDTAVTEECGRLRMERGDFRFTRRDVRAWSAWGDTVLKKHLGRLEDMEYLLAHRGGRGQSFVYELVFIRSEDPAKAQFPGLIDVYDGKKSQLKEEQSLSGRPHIAAVSRDGRSAPEPIKTGLRNGFPPIGVKSTDTGGGAAA
jgi:DNA primase